MPVEGHVYVGVDWRCQACETPNSRAADFCVNCGNPRDGNAAVKLVEDAAGARPPSSAKPARPMARAGARPRWIWAAAAAGAVVVTLLLVALFWTRDTAVTIAGHQWRREIDVEQMAPRADSSWCSSMPGDAYSVRRSREVRSHRDVPDGQECHTVHHDNGDGTYSTSQECRTKYRSEPIYDDKCYFTVNRWGVSRTERAQGAGVSPAPVWPPVRLARSGSCLGCEREGARREVLSVAVDGPKRDWDCEVDGGRWQRLVDGAAARVKVRVITGGAVCASLR